MTLISDTIKLQDLGQQFESWLNTTLFEDNTDVFNPVQVTNRMVMNTGEYPTDWFNPFTLTVDELDKMREVFTGGFKKWANFVKDNIPFLDSKEEGKLKRQVNKERDIRLCGTKCRVKLNPLTRKMYHEVWRCKRRECLKCTLHKERKLFEFMTKHLVGKDYVIVSRKEAESMVEKYGSTSTFCKPIDKDHVMVVNDKGIGETFTDAIAKQHAKIPPQGMNISGKLGKNSGVSPANADDDPFEATVEVSVAEFIVDGTKADMEAIEVEYSEEVAGISPDKLEDCQKAIYQCENILQRIIKDRGIGIFFLYRTKSIINEKEFLRVKESNASIRQSTPS